MSTKSVLFVRVFPRPENRYLYPSLFRMTYWYVRIALIVGYFYLQNSGIFLVPNRYHIYGLSYAEKTGSSTLSRRNTGFIRVI